VHEGRRLSYQRCWLGRIEAGGKAKGKGDEWEERPMGADTHTACLECASHFIFSLLRLSFSHRGGRGRASDTTPRLNYVPSSRSIPVKSVLVLGYLSTEKSTLVSALLQKPPADAEKDIPHTDFAVGCECNEGEEGLSPCLPSLVRPDLINACI
jgi:hypothetical protein